MPEKLFRYLSLAVILALAVLLPANPAWMQAANRDSGVSLCMGWRILDGEVQYRDVWDHKPPGIFYLDALGLVLANGSSWGVWVIEAFLDDLRVTPSRLVICLPGNDFDARIFPVRTDKIEAGLQWITAHFADREMIDGWTVYEFTP